MATTAKTQSAAKSQAREKSAVDLLKADHARIAELFSEFEQADGESRKRKLAGEICSALKAHAQAEEELFYPEVKAVLDDHELVPEAAVEHGVIKTLVAQIESDEAGGEMYEAKVKVLAEYVKHHVKEEEREIFPKLRKSPLDLAELGARMAQRLEAFGAARH